MIFWKTGRGSGDTRKLKLKYEIDCGCDVLRAAWHAFLDFSTQSTITNALGRGSNPF
jgi:hypothetical protein